jgi:drug/metabolite transporter (DMT)-like permease
MARDARFPPYAGLALAVLSVSFAAPLFRLAEAPPLTASFWRLGFAVLLLLPFTAHAWKRWFHYSNRDQLATVVAGVALGLHFGLWVTSLFLTTVAASVSLVTLQAVFVALGSHFLLRERLGNRGWIGVVLATTGAILIGATDGLTAPDTTRALLGDVLALLGGVCSAVYFLVGRRLRQRHELVTYVTPVYAVAALTLVPFALLSGQGLTTDLGGRSFVFFVLLAAIPMLGGHTLANWCMRYLPAPTVATWILLEPIGAALLAWPILGEVPHYGVAVGAALVLWGASQTVRRVPVAVPAGA